MDPVERLYLDYNATSPLSQSVQHWLKSGEMLFANPSSQHSAGKASRKLINESRAQIFACFNKQDVQDQLLFHSGASEGFSTFAHSFAEMARLQGKELLICFSRLDHPAVTQLEQRYFGPQVKFLELKMNELHYDHKTNFETIKDKKDNNPELLILYHHLWVHNESGVVSALDKLASFKTIPDLYVHVDAVQAPGKIPQWRELNHGDIFTFSAHKFGALKGVGFSFIKKGIPVYPLISGGGQQNGGRSGTENPMGVQSVALALKDLQLISVSESVQQRQQLENFMLQELGTLGGIIAQGELKNSNTIYFYFNDLASDISLALFDLHGLMLSAGSACSSGAAKPSALLIHLGFKERAKNGLRLSAPLQFTADVRELIEARFKFILNKVRLI